LLYFDAKPEDRVVQLNWATESERNNAYFVIERSADLENWTFVDQLVGAGNSSLQKNYHSTDFSPLNGLSYYRLKQIDADGSESISEIRSVLNTTGFTLSPNPATDELQISGLPKSGNTQIKLLNTVGQVITVFEANNSVTSLNIASISDGIYFICIDGYEPIQFLKSNNK